MRLFQPSAVRRSIATVALVSATGILMALGGTTPSANAQSAPTASVTGVLPASVIKHIIFFIKENRTFDDYFGTYPGANGATTAIDSNGATVPLKHQTDSIPYDIDHSSQGAIMAYDNGKMDKFNLLTDGSGKPAATDPYANNSLTQLTQADIPNYWKYAQNFVLGDNMFSSLMGPSFPNHLYTIAAQSGGVINNPATDKNLGTLFDKIKGWGCDVTGQQVQVKDASGKTQLQEACFDFNT